jgi:hypothetical protein
MKKITTTYTLEKSEIEAAIMEVLRKKHKELCDEFEGELKIFVCERILAPNARLFATIILTEEQE